MQLVAREMNLSETAFLLQQDGGYRLRWFTPTMEEDLCGHATLASAHVLWEQRRLRSDDPAVFETRSGVLTAQKTGAWIEMDFPATPASANSAREEVEAALGIKVKYVGQSCFDFLAELETEDAVRALRPDLGKIGRLPARGLMVTSRASDSHYDFVSRFFGPASGIDEDPVTGSAYCCLGPYWKDRLGRDDLVGYQASARGGFVRVRCAGDRVLLAGQAITVMRCELL